MASDGEGIIRIPMEEFYEFALKYAPTMDGAEVIIGPPRMLNDEEVEMDFAWSTSVSPSDWAEEPKALTQLKNLGKEEVEEEESEESDE